MVAEHGLDRARLVGVVDRRRRAVRVEILDVGRRQPGVVEGAAHGLVGALSVRVDHVLGVGRHAVADDLGEDLGAARLGVLQGFQHEDAGAFAQNRSVALLGEREAALRRKHVQCLPGFHGAVVDDGFRRAGDSDVDHIVADVVAGDADSVRCGRAGAAGGEGRTLDAELNANVGARRGADDAQECEGVRRALSLNEQCAIGILEGDEAASARADDACRTIGVGEGNLEARLLHRLVGGGRREPGIAVRVHDELVALEVAQALLWIEILDLGSDEDLQIFERKTSELGHPALRGLHRGPEIGYVEADRRNDAHSGHHDAACAVRVCHRLPAGLRAA